jgi:hypothetical protein
MANRTQEIIVSCIILGLVIRNILRPYKTPFDWVMILIGVGLLARQGYAFYQSRQ